MIPEPSGRLSRGRCPCCHTFDMRLYPCLGCDWAGATGRVESKERLERLSPGSGPNAYNPTGCRVCANCWRQMSAGPLHCPLRLFHDLAPASTHPLASSFRQEPGSLASTWALWEQWLQERGWPEITECFWRRLVAFLQAEQESTGE